MIDAILISRMLVDYFWEYKVLSILYVSACGFLCVIAVVRRGSIRINFCASDMVALMLLSVLSLVLARSFSDLSLIEYGKFATFILFYFIGRIVTIQNGAFITTGRFCFLVMGVLILASLLGRGYQLWGSVSTFTGGYFFKTDLALMSLMGMTITLATSKSSVVKYLSVFGWGYLIFESNSRIAIPLFFLCIAVVIALQNATSSKSNLKTASRSLFNFLILGGLVGLATLAAFAVMALSNREILGFDVLSPLSESNTSGRTIIWDALYYSFQQLDFTSKILGAGFDADALASSRYIADSNLEGFRAHNSYLYVLLSSGYLGLTLFAAFFSIACRDFVSIGRYGSELSYRILAITVSLLAVLLVMGLTTEVIIRAQLMIPLFFCIGLTAQISTRLTRVRKSEDVFRNQSTSY